MSRPAWLVADGNLAFADSTAANAWATANPSLVYEGLLATIGGSAVVWTSGAWAAVGGGSSILPCFDTIAARDAAYPTPSLGQKVCIKRLCGNGYFEQSYNGSRWESFGSIVSDMGVDGQGYLLTAIDGSWVQMQQYVLPPNIIGDKETWVISISLRNGGVYTGGYCNGDVTIGGMSEVFPPEQVSSQGGVARFNSIFTRNGSTLLRRRHSGLTYVAAADDVSVDLSTQKNATLYAKALFAGDTVKIDKWSIARNESV